jgi:xanthine dehydrogenase large subunit
VKITATDTGKVPNTSATAASSGTDLNGMAVKAACDTIRDRMAEFIAERHQAEAASVRFEGAGCMWAPRATRSRRWRSSPG